MEPAMLESARPAAGIDFHAAIAQWRLALRTEVKRASSLPSAMFDACDPMLETRLAQSAEAMLALLQEPAAEHLRKEPHEDLRLETVALEEMARLPDRIGSAPPPLPDLEDGLPAEYLGVLSDLCCQGGTSERPAAARLCSDFGIASSRELDKLVQALAEQTTSLDSAMADEDLTQATLLRTCHEVQAAIQRHGLLAEDATA
jgi:hypothetical protein